MRKLFLLGALAIGVAGCATDSTIDAYEALSARRTVWKRCVAEGFKTQERQAGDDDRAVDAAFKGCEKEERALVDSASKGTKASTADVAQAMAELKAETKRELVARCPPQPSLNPFASGIGGTAEAVRARISGPRC